MLVQPPGIEGGQLKSNATCRRRFSNADEHVQDYGAYPLMTVLSVPHYREYASPSLVSHLSPFDVAVRLTYCHVTTYHLYSSVPEI